MMRVLLLMVMVLLPLHVWAQEGTIVLLKNTSFLVKPPLGWVADTQSGASQGVNVVVYPQGSSWQKATSVMYARVEEKLGRSLEGLVADDIQKFQQGCPAIQIQSLHLQTKIAYPARLRRFICRSGDAPNSELVAYIDIGRYFVIWVATSRTEKALAEIQTPFESILQNFIMWQVDHKQK